VGYRRHSNNAHQNPAGNVKAILSLIDYEQRGGYPGGKARRKERYLWIGSVPALDSQMVSGGYF
jgi:hypothetical protein